MGGSNIPHPELMLSFLMKDYPQVAKEILKKIEFDMPSQVITDFSKIPLIIEHFKACKGISNIEWTNQKGKKRITGTRELLVAIVLLFYHPERILSERFDTTRFGLIKALSTETGCKKCNLSSSVTNAVVAFKTYRSFKEEVFLLYHILREKKELFNA